MEMSRQEVLNLATLARLELTEAEIAKYQQEIPEILEYVGKLSEVDTKDVAPMTGGVSYSATLRKDEVVVQSEAAHRALIDAFPAKAGDLLKVKAVFAARTEKKDVYEGE